MAIGRMLNQSISVSLKFDALPDDTCRLFATWTIPFLDKRGVFYADPAIVRSFVFPCRVDITVEMIDGYIKAMKEVGLLETFEAKGRKWQYWPGFVHNQSGYISRELTSFPEPPDYLDSISIPDDIEMDRISNPEAPEKKRNIKEKEIEKEIEKKDAGADAPPPPADPLSKPRKMKPEPKQTENYRPIFGWLQEFCQMNAPQRIGKAAKHIDDSGAALNACEKFARWWESCDWRGQKGHRPTPEQVWAEWPKAVAWDGSTRPSSNGKHEPNEPKGFSGIREAARRRGIHIEGFTDGDV